MANLVRLCFENHCRDIPQSYTKEEVDAIIRALETGAYKEVDQLPDVGDPRFIYLVENPGGGFERWIYSEEDGWKDLGSTDITLDKSTILAALGYRETTISMTDIDDNTYTQTILVEDTGGE